LGIILQWYQCDLVAELLYVRRHCVERTVTLPLLGEGVDDALFHFEQNHIR
jgi:hypothetical protein